MYVSKALLAASLLLTPADYTVCTITNNGPITSQKPHFPFQRQPDSAASTLYPKTMVFDGMPPERMRGPATVTIKTGAVAECGVMKFGVFEACTRDGLIYMPNPCDYGDKEEFARLLCHEIAHEAWHWPQDHGE